MKNKKFKQLGFKKKWLTDKSGWWWEKKMDKHFTYYVDEEFKDFNLMYGKPRDMSISFKSLEALLQSMERYTFKY